MKHQFASLAFSSFVAADAGSIEAQFDARITAVFTAYYHALKDGQKSQLLSVQAACSNYSTPKACLEAAGSKGAASKMARIYRAYGSALDMVGIPAKLKGTLDEVEVAAETASVAFMDVFNASMEPAPKKPRKEAPSAPTIVQPQADVLDATTTELAALEQATDDAVLKAVNLIRQGVLSNEHLQMLSDALDEALEQRIAEQQAVAA